MSIIKQNQTTSIALNQHAHQHISKKKIRYRFIDRSLKQISHFKIVGMYQLRQGS